PVLHWFIDPANLSAASTLAGTRASFFFLNHFYDNAAINLHGQSTSGFAKKSFNVDFNDGNRFTWSTTEPLKVKDINLLTNYADKARVRNTLAHDTGRLTGTVYHFALPVRVQQNAAFLGVWDMVEDGDDRLLARNGLDPDGAFYKMYNLLDSSTSNVEKKTRKEETQNTDLQALVDGLNPSTALAARRTYAYDNVNLPATINYLITRQLNSDSDHGHKNYYLYRDTNRTREWQLVIWDVDLSWGHNWNGTDGYFDNNLVSTNPLNAGASGNRLYDLVYNSPELRAMFLRRMRTVMDGILQAPGTVNGERETFARSLVALIDPDPANPSPSTDGDRDFTKWGSWGSPQNRPREELERVITGYLAPRRTFLFNTTAGTRPTLGGDNIPDTPQNVAPGGVVIESLDFLPVSGNQAEEYVVLRNTTAVAVDLTGWTLAGAIDHAFAPGTVIPAGAGTPAADYIGLLHVAKDAAAFRARALAPTGGQRRFIQGNYSGQLSARGEQLTLLNPTGGVIHTYGYAGTPTAHQTGLRVSELGYAPPAPTPAESAAIPGVVAGDFEFIELVNIGTAPLSLAGVTFAQGITFTFPSGTVAPGARIILAKSPAAFALRYPGVSAAVYGPYDGQIDNTGERLELSDPVGENIFDFQFKDGWYPATAGSSGHSLVNRDPAGIAYDHLGIAVSWAISETAGGGPGVADTVFAQAYLGWDNDYFSQIERDNPLISGPDADPDGDGRSNLQEYVFGSHPRLVDATPVGRFEWGSISGVPHPGMSFVRAARALDLDFALVASSDLSAPPGAWTPVATVPLAVEAAGALTERVLLVDPDFSSPGKYYRIRATYSP
ncbi:MAG: CotH kinase family protein, partial [Kiritimatiellia bacterium]